MKRVYIITGADGHLAKATIERLRSRDCLIRGLILPGESGTDDSVVSYYRGDITQPETLDPLFSGLKGKQIIVLHMAALISVQDTVSPELYEVNVTGTKNIIEKCRQYRVRRLLYVSSVHAIPVPGSGGGDAPARRSSGSRLPGHPSPSARKRKARPGRSRICPASFPDRKEILREISSFSEAEVEGAYAKTKAEATQLVLDAGAEGLDVVVVQPSAIFGPGDTGRNHITQLMAMYLKRRLPAGVRGGYDLVDVRDVADGIVSAIDKGRSGECYLLTNRYVTIPELLEHMRTAAGRKIRKVSCPIWLAKAAAPFIKGAAALKRSRPIFTKHALETLESRVRFSHKKATQELNYRPREINETVADTLEYLKNQLPAPRCICSSMRRRPL